MLDRKKRSIIIGISIIVIICIFVFSIFIFYEFFYEEKKPIINESEIFQIDDRISPLTPPAVGFEIHRIRKHGIEEVMRKRGSAWKKQPSFSFNLTINDISSENPSFTGWDTGYRGWEQFAAIDEDQGLINIELTIFDIEQKLFRTTNIEAEKIELQFNSKEGRWTGDDYVDDRDGYGHFNGENYEVWFDISLKDYDGDGIPYWTEVNILKTDPMKDDSKIDSDEDGIPNTWEWKWGYPTNVSNNHSYLDPDFDGLDNIEEYKMEKWLASPFQPEIYIEVDFMQGKIFGPDYVFWEESQQLLIEKFSLRRYERARNTSNSISVHIDDGRMGGGGEYFDNIDVYIDQASGIISEYYKYHFDDDRKGIFRYLVMVFDAGWAHPQDYKGWYDVMAVGASPNFLLKLFRGFNIEPRMRRIVQSIQVMHETGHTCNLIDYCEGIDNASKEAIDYWRNYQSCMNYHWMYRPAPHLRILWGKDYGLLLDYSDGRRNETGHPDCDDWKQLDISYFQKSSHMIEGIETL